MLYPGLNVKYIVNLLYNFMICDHEIKEALINMLLQRNLKMESNLLFIELNQTIVFFERTCTIYILLHSQYLALL